MDFNTDLIVHKKLFPKATANGQLQHLAEEIEEYEKAQSIAERYQELGDVLVCVLSLFRYEETEPIGRALMRYYYYNHDPEEREKRLKYYKRAMEKCKKRVSENRYMLINGNYVRKKVDINV